MTRTESALKSKSGHWRWRGARYEWEKFKRLFSKRRRAEYRRIILTEEDLEEIRKIGMERFLGAKEEE